MSAPRGLTAEEAAAWAKLAATVVPLNPHPPAPVAAAQRQTEEKPDKVSPPPKRPASPLHRVTPPAKKEVRVPPSPGLDSHWDRRFRAGAIAPDFTLDLHGLTLDGAHARLDDGLAQARAMGARVVLLIAGKARPVEAADRGSRRGAIRAKVLDWLAAGPHGSSIAAIRKAHRRHGGDGALYVIFRKPG